MRNTMLILHVLFAGLWIGASGSVGFLNSYLAKRGKVEWVAFMGSFVALGKHVFPVAGVGVLLTGIVLVLDSELYGFSDVFVVVGVGVVVVGVFLGNTAFGPIAKRAVATGTDLDAGMVRALSSRFMAFGVLDFSLLVVAVSVMILRTGA